jgi:hypothetical protein
MKLITGMVIGFALAAAGSAAAQMVGTAVYAPCSNYCANLGAIRACGKPLSAPTYHGING